MRMAALVPALLLALAALLAGCGGPRTSAPVVDRRPVPAPAPKPPVAEQTPVPGATAWPAGTYQVKRGDTLYSIALDHGADPRDLAQWNKLDNPNRIQAGQVLRVTPPESEQGVQVGAARGSGPVESRPIESRPLDTKPAAPDAAPGTRTEPKAVRLPYSPENVALLQKNDPGAAPPPPKPEPAPKPAAAPPADPKDAEAIEFIWPARGKLLAGFSEPASKGLDIGGKPGDPVVAAAAGRVIYIGTGIRGYGKLIVIKHDNNFNSVYAHNREILVKQDQQVTRGQKIAELGDTDADAPKLHFEIRKSGKPVDPARYLPPS
jgi:lipoprotein NlpD